MRALSALLIAVLLAGCSSSSPPADPDEAPDPGEPAIEPTPQTVSLYSDSGSITGDAWVPTPSGSAGVNGLHEGTQVEFDVPEYNGTRDLFVNVTWTAAGSADLDFRVKDQWGYTHALTDGDITDPDYVASLVVEDPAPGPWTFQIWSDGPVANAEFDVAISLAP